MHWIMVKQANSMQCVRCKRAMIMQNFLVSGVKMAEKDIDQSDKYAQNIYILTLD